MSARKEFSWLAELVDEGKKLILFYFKFYLPIYILIYNTPTHTHIYIYIYIYQYIIYYTHRIYQEKL